MVTDLVRRVLQGDLPEQLSAFAVYDFHKLRMVGDVVDLADTWNRAFRTLRLASCTAGTAALVFGIAGFWTLDAHDVSPTVAVLRLVSFLAFLTAVVVEERLKRRVFGQLTGTISALVDRWQNQLAGIGADA